LFDFFYLEGNSPVVTSSPAPLTAQYHGTVFTLGASWSLSDVPPVLSVVWQRSGSPTSGFGTITTPSAFFTIVTNLTAGTTSISFLGNSTSGFNMDGQYLRAGFTNCLLPLTLATTYSNTGRICQGTAPVITYPVTVAPVVISGLTANTVRVSGCLFELEENIYIYIYMYIYCFLSATAIGAPTIISVVWTESSDNGVSFGPIGSSPIYNVSGSNTSSLLDILASPSRNALIYKATFSSCLDSNSTSTVIRLCVGDLPVVSIHPVNVSIVTGSVTSFRSTASGVPPVTAVIWEVATATGTFAAVTNSYKIFFCLFVSF
jgi:hypothetical protein